MGLYIAFKSQCLPIVAYFFQQFHTSSLYINNNRGLNIQILVLIEYIHIQITVATKSNDNHLGCILDSNISLINIVKRCNTDL